MLLKEKGIILSTLPFQDHDLILKALTPEKGIASFLMKGGQSSKRRGGTSTDPLTEVEITYFQGKSTLYSLREITLLNPFLPLRESWDHLEVAMRLLQKIQATQMEGKPSLNLYHLFAFYLANLHKAPSPNHIYSSFLLKLLRHEGLFGPATTCSTCNEELLELRLFGMESFCLKHAPKESLLFTLKETEQIMLLAFCRNLPEIIHSPLEAGLHEKIETLFELAISQAK
jgi:DNA repair protein RecO (recombination protein O)